MGADPQQLWYPMEPLVENGLIAPLRCEDNDHACVDERLEACKADTGPANARDIRHMQEFITEFNTATRNGSVTGHDLRPLSAEEVIAGQPTAGKRAKTQAAADEANITGPDPFREKPRSFQKAEGYGWKNDKASGQDYPPPPRNITPSGGFLRLAALCFSLAAAKVFKKTTWYAFGRAMSELGAFTAAKIRGQPYIIQSDFTRFDGTVSEAIRELELIFLLSQFHPSYH
jgi:hypothetical protein